MSTNPTRRPILDPEMHRMLVDATRLGTPMRTAAMYAGISVRTFEEYISKGRDELERRENGEEPNPDHDCYVELLGDILKARADAAVRSVGVLQKSAQGGFVTETSTRKYRHPETGALVEEVTEKRAAPDWRASAWFLERQHRAEWGKDAIAVEVTGAGGGAVQIESKVDAGALAEKIVANIAALAAAQQVPQLETGPVEIEALPREVVLIDDRVIDG